MQFADRTKPDRKSGVGQGTCGSAIRTPLGLEEGEQVGVYLVR